MQPTPHYLAVVMLTAPFIEPEANRYSTNVLRFATNKEVAKPVK
jgi:hypothetical protein